MLLPRFPTEIVAATHIYIADGHNPIRVVDVADPTSPVTVGHCGTSWFNQRLALSNGLLFATCINNIDYSGYSGFQIFDLSDPSSPTTVGNFTSSRFSTRTGLSADGHWVCMSNSWTIDLLDVTVPSSPTIRSSYQDWAGDVFFRYPLVYTMHYDSIEIVDFTDLSSPTRLSTYPVRSAESIHVSGRYLYVGNDTDPSYDNDVLTI